jgi:hypothetical protein
MYEVGLIFPGKIKQIDSRPEIAPDASLPDQEMRDVQLMVLAQVVGLLLHEWMGQTRCGPAYVNDIHLEFPG